MNNALCFSITTATYLTQYIISYTFVCQIVGIEIKAMLYRILGHNIYKNNFILVNMISLNFWIFAITNEVLKFDFLIHVMSQYFWTTTKSASASISIHSTKTTTPVFASNISSSEDLSIVVMYREYITNLGVLFFTQRKASLHYHYES